MAYIRVVPAPVADGEPSRIVRRPDGLILPDAGMLVEEDVYWHRRRKDGDALVYAVDGDGAVIPGVYDAPAASE